MMNTKQIIKDNNFSFKKKFGQNFITNPQILRDIVQKAEIAGQDIVIEIGPGAGGLTAELAKVAKQVIAIEIDTALEPILAQTLKDYNNIKLIFEDVLKWDLKAYLAEHYPQAEVKVVANLPYYITTPIIMKLLEDHLPLKSITVMVQKEVADRINALPGTKEYGAITLAVNYYAEASIVLTVPPHVFLPAPKVMSAVLHLKRKEPLKDLTQEMEKKMFDLIAAAFEQRRKTLVNALGNKGIGSKEKLKEVLSQMGLSEDIRGERLTLEDFIVLAEKIEGLPGNSL